MSLSTREGAAGATLGEGSALDGNMKGGMLYTSLLIVELEVVLCNRCVGYKTLYGCGGKFRVGAVPTFPKEEYFAGTFIGLAVRLGKGNPVNFGGSIVVRGEIEGLTGNGASVRSGRLGTLAFGASLLVISIGVGNVACRRPGLHNISGAASGVGVFCTDMG